jgi:hypothetical protein
MSKSRVLMILLIIIGAVCFALAIYYWVTPAGSLPSFFPGHLAGSAQKHLKHGLLGAFAGILCFVGAWMLSGKKEAPVSDRPR